MSQHHMHLEGMIPHEMIAVRAHQLWVARGCPEGQAEQDWFAARSELEQELTLHFGAARAEARHARKTAA
jgi:hypothetical protein